MKTPPRGNRKGLIPTDFVLLILIAVLAVMVTAKGCAYREMRFRKQCTENMAEANRIVWKILQEKKKELPQLSSGYILHKPDGTVKMILVFLPDPGENLPSKIEVDLSSEGYAGKPLCPMHTHSPTKQPVIDYWYGAGRWWCLYNKYHN
jgi:hypothetical protein